MRSSLVAAVPLALLLAAQPAAADGPAPAYTYGKQEDVKDVKEVAWTGNVSAGLVATTGNSRTTTATGGASVTRKDADNKLDGSIAVTYAHATTRIVDDVNGNMMIDPGEVIDQTATSANNAAAKLRYD